MQQAGGGRFHQYAKPTPSCSGKHWYTYIYMYVHTQRMHGLYIIYITCMCIDTHRYCHRFTRLAIYIYASYAVLLALCQQQLLKNNNNCISIYIVYVRGIKYCGTFICFNIFYIASLLSYIKQCMARTHAIWHSMYICTYVYQTRYARARTMVS